MRENRCHDVDLSLLQKLMEWKAWANLPLMQRAQLPPHPGIYVVVDAEDDVWYVGRATNLNARWNGKSHHRYKQLSRTDKKRSYRIHWQLFPAHQLNDKEQHYINLFKPHLNYSRVKAYARKAVQPNAEISRLLKVLNKKTLLFPTVRSVVLGYYTDLDEDEAGDLQEDICIVVAVNINDHDGPILRSVKKSFSRKGKSLKGCWKAFESDCGIGQPISTLVFIWGNTVYEFVCVPKLIETLEKDPSHLQPIQLEKQTVLALKEPNTIASLIDESFLPGSADYLRYRTPDLQPMRDLTVNR